MSSKLVTSLEAWAEWLGRPVDWAGRAAALCCLFLVLLVAGNVLARYGFSLSNVALQELEWHLISPIALIGMAYALRSGEHVRVDVVYEHLGPRSRGVVDLIASLLTLALAVIMVWLSIPYIEQSYTMLEGSPDPGGLPYRWVLKAFIPLGFVLLILQALSQSLNALAKILDPGVASASPQPSSN